MSYSDIIISVFLIALSSARITRLIVSDSITQPIRDRFLELVDNQYHVKDEFFAKLIHCPWCTGFWITIIIGLLYLYTDFMLIPCVILSATYIQGFLNSKEE